MTTTSVLERISIPVIRRKKFRVAEFHEMMKAGFLLEDSTTEIIEGELIDKMGIGSRHAGTVNKLSRIMTVRIGEKAVVAIQNPVYLNEWNEPLPDISILKPREDFYTESNPTPEDVLLVVEVSDSTVEYDREVKKTLYAQAGIIEFWLVNLKQKVVEVHTQPENESYRQTRLFGQGEVLQPENLTDLKINVEEILS